jgi:hypothetical protein
VSVGSSAMPKMKISDDYRAKLKLWVLNPRVEALPKIRGIPAFHGRKFSSYAEMNGWKEGLLRQIALSGGVHWTK